MTGPVVVAAGGTGGHVFPALALMRALRDGGIEPALVTDRRGEAWENEVGAGRCHTIRAGAVSGRGIVGALWGGAQLAAGFLQARQLFRRLVPRLAIGFGGYASLPPVAAAASLRIPVVVHESNAVFGRANRWLSARATAVATAFPNTGIEGIHTGVPVREAFISAREIPYAAPRDDDPVHILVVGGSQGARVLGRVVPQALAALPAQLRKRFVVSQQCRSEDEAAARDIYEKAEIRADVRPFIDDVPARLGKAHLVVSRAGASTIAELTTVGRPAIFVPYRYAADDHQTANARAVAGAGGGWLEAEETLNPADLGRRVTGLLREPDALERAAARARCLGCTDSAARLVKLVRCLSNGGAP